MYKALVETGLAASVSGSLSQTLDPYLYEITAMVGHRGSEGTGQSLDAVEGALNAEMEKILQQPITEEELQTAIKQSKAQFAYSSESVTNQGFWLGYSSVVADIDWLDAFLTRLAAVTVDDVTRVAGTYLSRHNRTMGRYLPEGL